MKAAEKITAETTRQQKKQNWSQFATSSEEQRLVENNQRKILLNFQFLPFIFTNSAQSRSVAESKANRFTLEDLPKEEAANRKTT